MLRKKIIKIVATRCQILRLKCIKFDFGAGGAYNAPPDRLAGFEGPTSKGGQGRENGRGERGGEGGEGRGGRRREGEKKGGEGKAFLVMSPRRLSALNPPLSVMYLYLYPDSVRSSECFARRASSAGKGFQNLTSSRWDTAPGGPAYMDCSIVVEGYVR